MENTPSVAASLNLQNEVHRTVCDLVRHFHSGRWPIFSRMLDVQIVKDELVELAQWRGGGYVIARWSLTEVTLRWQDCEGLRAARAAFHAVAVR